MNNSPPSPQSYRVIAPDFRGFGTSEPTPHFTLEDLARDIHSLANTLDASPFVLGGFSMGGCVALAYAKRYAATLRGLILVDTKAEGNSPKAVAQWMPLVEMVRAHGTSAVVEAMAMHLLPQHWIREQPNVVEKLRSSMEACSPLSVEYALRALLAREDNTEFLRSIDVPTLIMVGELDGWHRWRLPKPCILRFQPRFFA